ncbi:MAG TPA: hypothetical protein VHI71_06465 [Actinomycetota bacterium]|nr:hypothetical protein [Actinomycetota bacterium]
MDITLTQLLALDADDDVREAMTEDLPTFVANLSDSGMYPTVDVLPTSAARRVHRHRRARRTRRGPAPRDLTQTPPVRRVRFAAL